MENKESGDIVKSEKSETKTHMRRRMRIIKKSGDEVEFDTRKIEKSITRANMDVSPDKQMTEGRIRLIAEEALEMCERKGGIVKASDVRTTVEDSLITLGSPDLARMYIRNGVVKSCA